MMQRVVADKLLGDPVLDGIGMMARVLIVDPESTVGSRPFRDASLQCAPMLRPLQRPMLALLTRAPTHGPGHLGRARPAGHYVDPPTLRAAVGGVPRRC